MKEVLQNAPTAERGRSATGVSVEWCDPCEPCCVANADGLR